MATNEEFLDKAILLATKYHMGQRDKTGHNYILHPLRVMEKVESIQAKIVAVLHDVVEDTEMTLEDLQSAGFDEELLTAISLLTRNKEDEYFAYVERISSNPLAKEVKIADLQDNLRDGCPKMLQIRYHKALKILIGEG